MATTTHDLKLRAILDVSQVKQQVQQLNSKNTVNLDSSGINNSINALNRTITKFTTSLEKLSQSTEQTSNKLKQTGQQTGGIGSFGKGAGLTLLGMAVNNVGRAAQNYYKTVGNEDLATMVSMGGKVGGSALAGFGIAGLPGAVAGAGIGGAEWWFENLADEAKKAAEKFKSVQESLEAWKQRIDAARLKDTGVRELENQMWLKEQLKTGSIKALQQERGYRINQIASSQSGIDDFRRKWGIYSPIETATTRAELLKTAAKDEKDSDRKKALEDEEKAIRASIARYEADIKARARATSEIEQIELVLKQRKTAEEAAIEKDKKEKEAADKLDKLNQKRLNSLSISEYQMFDKERIQQLIKSKDYNAIQYELASRQMQVQTYYDKYKQAAKEGKVDEAEEYFKQWSENRGQASQLKQLMKNPMYEQYDQLVNQLQKQLQPVAPVAQLQTMGGSMGWVDRSTESIDNNVQKIVTQLQSIQTLIRRTDTTTEFILG